jgi:murein DD-endopeptidase MepM/ murein hydrolase activator NlpD
MASRQWTVMVVPGDGATMRQFRVSREAVRLLVVLLLLLVGAVASLGAAVLVRGEAGRADARLVAKKQMMERELEHLVSRLATLERSLNRLEGKDAHYRLLAGLEPLDRDVLMAGIGGPDADSLEASELYQVDRQAGLRVFGAAVQLNSLVRRANVLASSWKEAEVVLSVEQERLAATPSISPTRGRVSSTFASSRLHPILGRARPHMGIDIVAPVGTPVVAPANGRVASAGRRGQYGLLVEIDHGHGMVTRHAHLSRTAVKAGEVVRRGDIIGAVGTTGLAAGPHLHYEVLVNGRHVNPVRYIIDRDMPD